VKVDSAIKSAGTTDIILSAADADRNSAQLLWSYLVRQEAEEVYTAHNKNNRGSRSHVGQAAQVAECFSYMMELCCRGHQSIDYDLTSHSANYLICDGIIKQQQLGAIDVGVDDADDGLWRTVEALQREMQFDVEYHRYVPSSPLTRFIKSKPYWSSPTYGFTQFPATIIHHGDLFKNFVDKLSVLKLSCCTFNLPSSPFLCCHNLRFLWLDQCRVLTSDGAGEEKDAISRFFQWLWVLDVRYTKGCDQILSARMIGLMIQLRELNVVGAKDWDVGQLEGGLPNIRKLRVTECTLRLSCSEISPFSEMNRMEFLDFSGNVIVGDHRAVSICGLRLGKSNISLERVVISAGVKKVSFRGCIKLKDILLSKDLYSLNILDISSTAVKILDLTQASIWDLVEVYLLDCEKLCAIVWPSSEDERRPEIQKLRIDTTLRDGCGGTRSSLLPALLQGSQVESEFDWYVSVRDARLLVSLESVYPLGSPRKIYMEISSPTIAAGASKNEGIIKMNDTHQQEPVILRLQQTAPALIYADITVDSPPQANDEEGYGDAPGITSMWPCPHVPHLPKESCYMHIQDQRGAEQSGVITVPEFVLYCAKILHVRDSLSITVLPSSTHPGSGWRALEWCRIERCPKLDCVFSTSGALKHPLRILWVSQLPKAHYICKQSPVARPFPLFPDLTSLHLDYCPRLIHIFPIGEGAMVDPIKRGFQCLETLEIIWCGDLTEVFPLHIRAKRYQERYKLTTLDFPKLKRIHLHELPKLHGICDLKLRMSAPELETVKVRGCWSLKRLPIIIKKEAECDCEKEWWDSLEWEDASQKKLYRPIHSKHFKKSRLLRRSVLR
jgi:hypothetical protein